VEAQEAGDSIRDAAEERRLATDERKLHEDEARERFRRRAAVAIGVLAALLAMDLLTDRFRFWEVIHPRWSTRERQNYGSSTPAIRCI